MPEKKKASAKQQLYQYGKDYFLPPARLAPPNPSSFMQPQALIPGVENIVESGYNFLRPLANFTEGLISPIDKETGLPNADIAGHVMTGVAGAKNAAKFLERLQRVQQAQPEGLAGNAIRFIRMKYPGINKLLQKEGQIPGKTGGWFKTDATGAPNTLGEFDMLNNQARILDLGNRRPLEAYVHDAGHEGVHGLQWNYQQRFPELLSPKDSSIVKNPKTGQFEYVKGEYKQPYLTIEEAAAIPPGQLQQAEYDRMQGYFNQPVELQAEQGGETAQRAWENFAKQVALPDTNPLNLNAPLTRETFQQIYQDALMKDYQQIMKEPNVSPGEKRHYAYYLKDALERAASGIAGKGFPVTGEDLFLDHDILAEIAKRQGYTSMLRDDENIPLNTIEDLIGIPRAKQYKEPNQVIPPFLP